MSRLVALEILSSADGEVCARVPVTDSLKQPLGLVHGGVYAVIADELAVGATPGAIRAISNQTSFLRPVTQGVIQATPAAATSAAPRRCGRSTSPTTAGACAPWCA